MDAKSRTGYHFHFQLSYFDPFPDNPSLKFSLLSFLVIASGQVSIASFTYIHQRKTQFCVCVKGTHFLR